MIRYSNLIQKIRDFKTITADKTWHFESSLDIFSQNYHASGSWGENRTRIQAELCQLSCTKHGAGHISEPLQWDMK